MRKALDCSPIKRERELGLDRRASVFGSQLFPLSLGRDIFRQKLWQMF